MGTKENLRLTIKAELSSLSARAKLIPLRCKKALVTGGGGFVGKAVVKNLLELGVETRVIGRHHYPEIAALGARCVVGDITDEQAMSRASKGVDIVFHIAALAGIWGPWPAYYQTNVVGTETVLKSCRENRVPMLVYTSTPSVVFDRVDICGGDERLDYARQFLCNYARSKVMAEKMVLAANGDGLLTCALRPHLIWGPGDPHLLPRLLASGRKRQLKMVGDGSNLVDISYIDNVAHAHLLAAKNLAEQGTAGGKPYFVSQGTPVNLWQWIDELFTMMDVPRIQSAVSYRTAYRLGGVLEAMYACLRLNKEPRMTRFLAEQLAKSHYFSTAAAKADLGYESVVSTEEGLRRTVQWLRIQ
jgi:nucleoside-diphosphate-sugar epimerase